MRYLVALLALIAVALGPLAAPAAAMSPMADCASTTMHHGGKAPPVSVEACCVAAAADLPATLAIAPTVRAPEPVPPALPSPELRDVTRSFDDPPPRR